MRLAANLGELAVSGEANFARLRADRWEVNSRSANSELSLANQANVHWVCVLGVSSV